MAALVSVEYLKTHFQLPFSDTSEDAALGQYADAATALINSWCRTRFDTHTVSNEYYSGHNTAYLKLRRRPVQSVTSVYLDGAGLYGQASGFAAATLLTAGTHYVLDRDQPDGTSRSGILIRIGGLWPGTVRRSRGSLCAYQDHGVGNIKVTYVAGYATVPADLQLVCTQIVAQMRQGSPWGGALASDSYEGYSVSLADPGYLSEAHKEILAAYRGLSW